MASVRCRRFIPALACGLLFSAAPLAAQEGTGTISGRVIDSTTQQPVQSANVVVQGTQRGAITGNNGTFTLVGVPAGTHQVRVSRIGFVAQTRPVTVAAGGTAAVDFNLYPAAAVLGEVVVTGYGTQRREAISGSVATVNAEQANVGVIANADQMLKGRVAGVNIISSNGEPGGNTQIRIRGGTSLSASNDPLYVVDGVPLQNEVTVAGGYGAGGISPALSRNPLNSLNPSDIQSITVLKDASATAIYGSRGANGVILIETKRGGAGRTTAEYETYVAAATAASKLDFLNGNEYRAFMADQVRLGTLPQSLVNDLGTANTDWEEELTKTGYTNNHNLSFSGGSQSTQYRASLNYFDQQGVVIANGLKRYQGRLNAQHQAGSKLNLALNLTASRVDNDFLAFENTGGFEGGVFTNMAFFNPTHPVRATNPTTGKAGFYETGSGSQSLRNPVALAQQIQDQAPENRVLGNLTGSLVLLPSLTTQSTLGVDYTDAVRQTYFPRVNPIGAQYSGLARQAQRGLQNLNFQQLLTFAPSIGGSPDHDLEVVGGYEYSQFNNSGFEVVMSGFITDAFRWDNLGAGTQANSPVPISYREESKLVSFFSRANYGFANKYFLTGVMRYDGSSRLAEGNKWALFPAVSASWRISNEEFMSGSPLALSSLSLRAGWGRQGNQAVRPYATQLLLRADNGARYPFGTTIATGLVAGQVENPNLKWETAEQTNVGLDYGFVEDRFTGSLDFYVKDTKDLLLDVGIPLPAVRSTRIENVGSIRNRGVELSLDMPRLIEGSRRTLSSGLVLTVERNEVTSLGPGRPFIATGSVSGQGQTGRFSQRLIVGEQIGTFWGAEFTRVNEQGKQLFRCSRTATDCVNGETTSPIADDERILGDANPDFTLGFNSNGTWGRFDASWLWRAEFGRDVFNNTSLVYASRSNAKSNRNFLRSALNDPTAIGEPAIYSSRWIEDGRFVRLQNATVGYTFALPGRIGGGRSTRVYLSGDNLLLFSPYSGYDPEVFVRAGDGVTGTASRGVDYLTYPRARTFTTGARIQF